MSDKNPDTAIEIITNKMIDPAYVKALTVFSDGFVPTENVRSHPGKGGKVFKYVSHVWVTRQLNAAFGQFWSYEVLKHEVFPDASAVAYVKLTVNFPTVTAAGERSIHRRIITEIGAFEDGTNKMPTAMIVSSAASRGLVKCTFRAFNLGAEFYEADTPMTSDQAWTALRKFAIKNNVSETVLIEKIKEAGITATDLVERYGDAYRIVYTLAGKLPVLDKVPDELV